MRKRTIGESIDFINKNMSAIRLNEISASKAITIYDKFSDKNEGKRNIQRSKILQGAVERAPMKVEFKGNNNKGYTAVFAIPIKIEYSLYSNYVKTGLDIISEVTGLELKESKELGLNKKVKDKFSKNDLTDNLNFGDLNTAFIVFFRDNDGKYIRSKSSPVTVDILYTIAKKCDSYHDIEHVKGVIAETLRFVAGSAPSIEFVKPVDARKFIKFLVDMIVSVWGIDVSDYLDWHEFML